MYGQVGATLKNLSTYLINPIVGGGSSSGVCVPLSERCKVELLRWRNLIGHFSEWVFPNFSSRRHPLQGGRKAWASTLKQTGLPFFPIYYLRHTFASRLTAAGVSPLTIA